MAVTRRRVRLTAKDWSTIYRALVFAGPREDVTLTEEQARAAVWVLRKEGVRMPQVQAEGEGMTLEAMERLEALERLCAQATTGPWTGERQDGHKRGERTSTVKSLGMRSGRSFQTVARTVESPNPWEDAAFIAAAREWMPKLIAVARAADEIPLVFISHDGKDFECRSCRVSWVASGAETHDAQCPVPALQHALAALDPATEARPLGMTTKGHPPSIFDLPEVHRLLIEVVRRNYSKRQLAEIVKGWRRDLRALVKRGGR